MITALLASAALLAGTALAGPGSAIVINSCNYDVYLANTPSAGGGYNAVTQTLSSGGSYSQVFTELSNGNGWSIKLSKDANAFSSNIMQYEYTYHDDGTIWFDLSDVNGNPWNGNWEITADGSCTPKQTAYQYATDDAYGMQACPDSSSITVTLCSGEADAGSRSPTTSAWSAPAAASPVTSVTSATSAASPTYPLVQASEVAPAPSWFGSPPAEKVGVKNGKGVESADTTTSTPTSSPTTTSIATPSPTTLVTYAAPAGTTVTNIQYEVVTQYVTATSTPKRHAHHPRHARHHF